MIEEGKRVKWKMEMVLRGNFLFIFEGPMLPRTAPDARTALSGSSGSPADGLCLFKLFRPCSGSVVGLIPLDFEIVAEVSR